MPEIVITEFMKESVVADLAKDYDVHFDVELWEKRAELETLVRDATALIVRNRTQVDRALIDAAPKLKVIGRLGVGLDNLDVPYCEKKGIPIRAARGANANSVAEYVITSAMILLRGRFYMSSDRLAAGAALAAVRSALLGGVSYLDGGWAAIVAIIVLQGYLVLGATQSAAPSTVEIGQPGAASAAS